MFEEFEHLRLSPMYCRLDLVTAQTILISRQRSDFGYESTPRGTG